MARPSHYMANPNDEPRDKHHPSIRRSSVAKLYELYGKFDETSGKSPTFNKVLDTALNDLFALKMVK